MHRHRGAFEYDWRTRFGLGLHQVGTRAMTWGEALHLAQVLARDPGTQVFAALAGWEYPVSREWIVTAELRDSSEYGRAGRKARPFPRPWKDKAAKRIGTGAYTPTELHVLLARHRQGGTDGGSW